MWNRRRWARLCLLLVLFQLTACQQYLFRQSDRLQITYPQIYSTVSQPLVIRWQARDFEAPRDGTFAVFIDRDPMPPGETLDYFDPKDRTGIITLSDTSYHVDVLTRRVGVDPAEQDHHDVTVVMLDSGGHRLGEYAGFTEFNVTGLP